MNASKPFQKSRIFFPGLIYLGVFIFCIGLIQPGSAAIFSQDGTEIPGAHLIETMNNATNVSPTPFPIQFFYNTHCGSCQAAIQYLDKFSTNHTDIRVEYHDLFNSTENSTQYNEYKTRFNKKDIHYPVIFMGNVAIMESGDITTYTEPLTLWYQANAKKDPLAGLFSWINTGQKET